MRPTFRFPYAHAASRLGAGQKKQNPQLWALKPSAACSLPAWLLMGIRKSSSSFSPPQLNGKADPNPRVECGICGFVFNGGTTRQKHHLRREKGKGVSICTEISSKDPALLAELQREQQQEMDNQQLQQARKRASSSASSSIPTKQQRLDGHLVRADKQKLYASIATFFYAEGIPFAKVRGAAQCSEAALNTQLVHAGR